MKNFWGVCSNGNFFVGCNGRTVYIFDKSQNEIAKFRDAPYVYKAKFIPDTNILIAKSTAGFLVVYDLDTLSLIKKITASRIGAQDEGFAITPDGKYLYNIEKPMLSTKTQLTIYDTSDFHVVKTLFNNDDKTVLDNLEFDKDTCYVLGFMRGKSGVLDYGFVAEFSNDEITDIKKIDEKRFDYIRAYKSWEDDGFTDKALQWSLLKDEDCIEKVSLSEIHKQLNNESEPKKRSIISKLFEKK